MTMKPPHPGETIKEEYLVPLGMSTTALAKELGIGAPRLNEVVRGRRSVTADTALRLARYFGTTPANHNPRIHSRSNQSRVYQDQHVGIFRWAPLPGSVR